MGKIGKKFIKETKYENLEEKSDQEKGEKMPELQLDYDKNLEMIELPEFNDDIIKESSFTKIVNQRKSVREYSDEKISLRELSYLLWNTQGIKDEGKKWSFRTVPSAGARHSFETYLLINNVKKLKNGLYRYLPFDNKLVFLNGDKNFAQDMEKACFGQKMITQSAVTFIWAAHPYRMTWRYQQRGYRYLFMDAGHVCQNLYLSAESIGCGTCAIGAYDDDKVNGLIGLDGEKLFVIYMGTVGKKKE
ncbi:MAG: SagB/ThcOx family dehydrogenase [Candidatus Mcinerneyibacterium aminivorans]|uniref:SagB/ThcOx family dehydrogenase n=1 Tax=Candidatus Mcinerneyibacterium aminivorans TaxID=2703815 RepID=A0A5D0MAK6_9BACT|nr:MAG: SagB/ThcOx family dehydrogenase [Candidatus Mcinerneyibacterium aminivorans]